jgi:hypothetical protein
MHYVRIKMSMTLIYAGKFVRSPDGLLAHGGSLATVHGNLLPDDQLLTSFGQLDFGDDASL